MRRVLWLVSATVFCLTSAACQPTAAPTPTVKATAARIASAPRQNASAPTAVPTPPRTSTPTLAPSATSTLSPTHTPTRTRTATPAGEVIITSTVESGWTRYEMQTSGFAVAIPDRWRPLDLNPTALDTDLAAFLEANPNYQGMLSTQAVRSLFASGLKFYAVESRPETPVPSFPMSMSILKIDTRVELALDAVVPATLAQLTAIADSSSPLTHRRVTLSGLDAQEFKYVAKTNTASGSPVRASATQYVVVRGTIQYVITFLSSIELASTYAPVFEKVARSFTVP